MRRLAGPVIGALLLAGSGCGASSTDDYCAALKDNQTIFSDDSGGLGLLANLPRLRALSAKAPEDLADEWQTVVGALDALAEAVHAAGVEPDDFENGTPPVSLSATQKAAIAAAASEVAAPDVVDAFGGIDQQARDVCRLQLGL